MTTSKTNQDQYLEDAVEFGDRQDWVVRVGGLDFKCVARRPPYTRAWCGYVEDRMEGVMLPEEEWERISVHGGITGGFIDSDSVEYIGFDCAHHDDWWPKRMIFGNMDVQSLRYWTFPMVKAETEWLARQIYGPG